MSKKTRKYLHSQMALTKEGSKKEYTIIVTAENLMQYSQVKNY